MKSRSSYSFFILVLAGTWTLSPTVAIPATQTQPDCFAAKAFFDNKLYEDAERIYSNLLKVNSKLDCAKKGINDLKIIPYQKAIDLYEEGRKFQAADKPELEKSKQKYSEALSIYPQFQKAKQALKEVEDLLDKEEKFNPAHQLAELGLHEEAREKIKKIIEEDPDVEVTDKEKNIFGGERVLVWQSILNNIELWMPIIVIGLLLVILLIRFLILCCPILKKLTDWFWELISQPSLNIEDFDKGGTELDLGKTLATMVEEECQNIDSKEEVQSIARKMTIVTAPTGKLELPDVKSLVPQLGIISQLTNLLPSLFSLLGRKSFTFTLSGYLHPISDRGVGLTLTLKNEQGTIISNCTIWQKDYDPELSSKSDKNPAPYYFLVEPAAIWTLFQLDSQITKLEMKKWCGVKNWKSYAYFRAGVYWRLQNKGNWAKLMFNNALNEDSSNRFAVLNLGMLDTLNSEYDRAIDRLNLAKKMSTEATKSHQDSRGVWKDAVWYKSSYQLAANYLYKLNIVKADEEAKTLVNQIKNYLDSYEEEANNFGNSIKTIINRPLQKLVSRAGWKPTPQELLEMSNTDKKCYRDRYIAFLKEMEPIVLSMYATVLVMNNRVIESEKEIEKIAKLTTLHSYRTHYNLACYHLYLWNYYFRNSSISLFFSGYSLAIDYYSLNIYYCLFKFSQYHYEEGLNLLRNSFDLKPSLAKWARKDPSLKGVRDNQETEGDFNELIARYDPPQE
jgi:hypothetical protein